MFMGLLCMGTLYELEIVQCIMCSYRVFVCTLLMALWVCLTDVTGKVAPFKELAGGVEFRAEIPKSASGKILRRQLKEELKAQQ